MALERITDEENPHPKEAKDLLGDVAYREFENGADTQYKAAQAQIPAIVAEAVIRDRKSIGVLLGNKALKRGELPNP